MAKQLLKVGTSGPSLINTIIGVASAGVVGYIAYTHFFQKDVAPAVAAAAEEMMFHTSSTDLVTLEEQLVNSVIQYAQNRDTALANRDRIRTAAQTYRIRLEDLIKEKLGGRLTDVQMQQKMTEMIKDLAATLNIALRSGMTPPNPVPWEFWKRNLECKGGERYSQCQNRCVPSYQPDPYGCRRPGFPTPFPRPPHVPPLPSPGPFPGPRPCGFGQRWSNCFKRCVPAGQSEPIVGCPPSFPRPGFPTPFPRPGWPFFPRPTPRPIPRGNAFGWWKKYFPSYWKPRPIPRLPPRPIPRPPSRCRRDPGRCRQYGRRCNAECNNPFSPRCRDCKCSCHGVGGFPGNFSGAARAYSVNSVLSRIHRKVGRKSCKKRCKLIRGRGRGDCEKMCKRHYKHLKRPPHMIPPPPIPIPLPPPYIPPMPIPTPPPYYPPAPPPYYPPAPPVYYPPPPTSCPHGWGGQWPNCLTPTQVVQQSTTPIPVYAGRARAMKFSLS